MNVRWGFVERIAVLSYSDYLRLLPKTELHCHFVSTMTAPLFIELADRYGVELPSHDAETLFDFADLPDFLVAFRAAHDVLRDPEDFERVAFEGVRHAVADGNLRYREYFVNPQYFAQRGLGYLDVMVPIISGLRQAEQEFGVGFRVIAAINRFESPDSALGMVRDVVRYQLPEVVGIGQDDLTPELTEDPTRFQAAYDLAAERGLYRSAHVGETDAASPEAVREAIEVLRCDRLDHGYRIVDDPRLVTLARDRQIPFTATPISTTICSGWTLDADHRIRRMIDAGLKLTVSTDDAMFFRTDVGREYAEGLLALGVDPETAKRISINGIDAAWCSDEEKRQLRADFHAQFMTLDALLGPDV